MTIKSDRWIRKMALEQGMITPFVEAQVREGTVSYGLSSYGYDMRVADEFKVFTNVWGTLIDPKRIDEKSFVEMKGDCIIPPNSFALARSVERFKIPRNVLCVVLGKCVSGDTRVVDADTGDYLPIREFAGRRATVGLDGWRAKTLAVSHHWKQGEKEVFRLTTRSGRTIKATANHPFRKLRGWTALSELRVGDRIAIAREIPVFGKTPLPEWEATLLGLMISDGQCHTPGHCPVYTTGDPVLAEACKRSVEAGGLGTVTFNGQFGYRCVNKAGRGGVQTRNRTALWLATHGLAVRGDDKFVPPAVFQAPQAGVRTFLRALFSGDGSVWGPRGRPGAVVEFYSNSRRLIEDANHLLSRFGILSTMRAKHSQGKLRHRLCISNRDHVLRFAREIGFVAGSVKQARLQARVAELPERRCARLDSLPSETWDLLVDTTGSMGRSLGDIGLRSTKPQVAPRSAALLVGRALDVSELVDLAEGPVWDAVESIEPAGLEEVFDITVPGSENFFANGIICHNSTYARCGQVVNVTPLEPGWEGYVTLEISNTTPLPAKIYANEGLCQVLFFESDEPCETSYADRKGKYQQQPAQIVLPRM